VKQLWQGSRNISSELVGVTMRKLFGSVVGGVVGGSLVWGIYSLFEPRMINDAQSALLLVPAVPAGALAGYSIERLLQPDLESRRFVSRDLTAGGVATLLLVAVIVWMGSSSLASAFARVASVWCGVPILIGLTQLVLAWWTANEPSASPNGARSRQRADGS
jgi:hypothetical protein